MLAAAGRSCLHFSSGASSSDDVTHSSRLAPSGGGASVNGLRPNGRLKTVDPRRPPGAVGLSCLWPSQAAAQARSVRRRGPGAGEHTEAHSLDRLPTRREHTGVVYSWIALRSTLRAWRSLAVTLALATLWGCVAVSYQPPGQQITPREGQTLVFGQLRFFHDGREFFPWEPSLIAFVLGTSTERHFSLLRLGRRAASAELHPDADGSLAIWLGRGDYALVGYTELQESGLPLYEVAALLRVPSGAVAAYAGELTMTTESHEGWYVSYSELGTISVAVVPIDSARATLERRLGTLPEPPVLSPWCTGEQLPGFNDPQLATRAKELLDHGCPAD